MPAFHRYIGIDYSGAATPTSSLNNLRVFMAAPGEPAREEPPPPSPRKYWTRWAIAEWLAARLTEPVPTIAGIDHAFSFPLPYFRLHRLPHDWQAFLDDFQRHWPTDEDHTYVDFVRDGACGNGAARTGMTHWRRLTDVAAGSAKSPFHFDVQGSVAKSTHAGLPWLRYLRHHTNAFFWPFDGWDVPAGRSAVVEAYPRLWNRGPRPAEFTADQFDAFVIAEWLRDADADGRLREGLARPADAEVREVAGIEGWILGVGWKDVTPEVRARYAETATRKARKPKSARGGPARPLRDRSGVPEISRFYGIVIGMYYEEHGRPHFHARFGDFKISVEIEGRLVRGEFPGTALRRVLDWTDLRQSELLDNWQRARTGSPLQRIDPLP
jgi:hypothetical protein